MADLLTGTPLSSEQYAKSTTDYPTWMQDAIYKQIQSAQAVANMPYEQYGAPTVAELSPMQQQAYSNVAAAQNAWAPALSTAASGTLGYGSAGTAGNLATMQGNYLNPTMAGTALGAGQGYFNQAGMYNPAQAAQPALSAAGQYNAVGAAQPYVNLAAVQDVSGAANPYLYGSASTNITGAAQPALSQAQRTTQGITRTLNPYLAQAGSATQQALQGSTLGAASPYLQAAGQTSAADIGQYMNPYQQNVLDTIAKQGARNLTENLLPGVSDAFIKAGQFGSKGMGTFGERALRDTQEAILNAQSAAAQQGYSQALTASQADLARQAQLAGTAGQLSGTDLSRALQAGAQYGNLGQTASQAAATQASQLANLGQTQGQLAASQAQNLANLGQTAGTLTGQQANIYANLGQNVGQLTNQQMQNLTNLGQTAGTLTSQQMQNLANLGQMQTAAGQAQQQYGLNAAQAVQAAQAADYQRQLSALQQYAGLAQQGQQMTYADTAALEAAGTAQRSVAQAQLDAALAQFNNAQLYPKQQLDWLSTQVRGLAPITPQTTTTATTGTGQNYSPSVLSQLAGVGTSAAALAKSGLI